MIQTKNTTQNEFQEVFLNLVAECKLKAPLHFKISFSEVDVFQKLIKKWEDETQALFLVYLSNSTSKNYLPYLRGDKSAAYEYTIAHQTIKAILRGNLKISVDTFEKIFESFKNNLPEKLKQKIFLWPISGYVKQIEHCFETHNIPSSIVVILNEILSSDMTDGMYNQKELTKLNEKIKTLINAQSGDADQPLPVYFFGDDEFKALANEIIDQQKTEDKKVWFALISLAQKANGSKPTQKYLNESKSLIDSLGADKFKKVTQEWFKIVINLKEVITEHVYTWDNGTQHTYNSIEFLSSFNSEALKGFVWMSSWFYDQNTIQTISKLAERSFKKIPQKGPAAAAVGNACLYTLYASKGLDGIAQLSRLRLKIKQTNTLALIEKYINEAAIKLGITAVEVEDLAVDDFKLINHQLLYDFQDYKGVIVLTKIGKSEIKWFKPDGKEQKTVPQFVKDHFDAKLKKLKSIQKQIDQTTSSQKERLDRMIRSNRTMQLSYFKDKFIQHGLLSFVIEKLIFKLSNENSECLAIFLDKKWYKIDYELVAIDDYTTVSLWHPVTSTTNEVKEWRAFLLNSQIQQPFKQAFREIYLLTDAEVKTKTYSNRMASHILKQHQYVTLAKGRNWKAQLIGSWDGGDADIAQLSLPEYNISVEYWVSALNAEDAFNEIGIWNYVTTDQIRFVNTINQNLIDLVDVHPIAFSEAMRDIDLFVGVASVGNDPTWSDSGGLPNYRNYWESYSFGDLSEIAKNRKEILQGLIPRLKIAPVSHIEDRFLIVKGKIRTYKIHIGSTNILMEPNDQYLCIVPDRSKKEINENLFIPFEGDNGLSVIISKAILLANDDKITDTSITSQINR